MNDRVKRVVHEAISVGVGIWVVLRFDPQLAAWFPDIGPGWRYAASAVVVAALIAVTVEFVFGRPIISVAWTDTEQNNQVTKLDARMSPRTRVSQIFAVQVSTQPSARLGYCLFKRFAGDDLELQIHIEKCEVHPQIDDSSKVDGVLAVSPDRDSSGVLVKLGKAPRRPGTWQWADIRWEDNGMKPNIEINVDYVLRHPKPAVELLAKILVHHSVRVHQFETMSS